MPKQERSLNKAFSAAVIMGMFLSACGESNTVNQDPGTSTSQPGETALAPTIIASLAPEATATPEPTPAPLEPIMRFSQNELTPELLSTFNEIISTVPAWASRPHEDFAYDWFVFSKDDGAYQESAGIMSVDNTAFVILRTQKSPENPDQILGDSTIRPLLFRTNDAGQPTYFIQLQSEDDSITEQIIMESTTRDGEAMTIVHLLDGTTLESTTASLTNPNEFSGKLAMAAPIEKIKGPIEVDPTLGVVRARSEYKQPIYWNGSEWQILYESTSYEGIYSEKYPPSLQTGSFIAESFGIEMPINWGIAADVPTRSVEIKPLGEKYYGEILLNAFFYRYKEIMKNDVTKEQYVELVKNGEGHVEIMYFDEITSEIKSRLVHPSDGISITINSNKNMPLNQEPERATYPVHTYITTNNSGNTIVAIELNREFINERIESSKNKNYSLDREISLSIFSQFTQAIGYFGSITPYQFSTGGEVKPSAKINSYFTDLLRFDPDYSPFWNNTKGSDSETPFTKAIYTGN